MLAVSITVKGIGISIDKQNSPLCIFQRGVPPADEIDTVGSLDLGGASTQIAFIPKHHGNAPHTAPRKLFGKSYMIYSYSYLCYGKSAAENRAWAEILANQTVVCGRYLYLLLW